MMMKSILLSLGLCVVAVLANTPISNIQVSLRGKKYPLTDITTVDELQERLEEASGVAPDKQGRVLFNGKVLSGSDSLSSAGVSDGDQLNVVPKSKKSSSSGAKKSAAAAPAASAASTEEDPMAAKMKEMLQQSGIDTNALDDMVKNMGGGGGEGGAPSMQESMEMMSNMMKSPIFTEYMNDPARLEESRQMILNNPMMKSMMEGMPGMSDILNDPDAWRETMQAAASMYQNMDQNDLMQAMMMGGAGGGAGGMPPGLFDGMEDAAAANTLALDELSEGED